MIGFLDVKASISEVRREIDDALRRVLDGGQYILGREVEDFESEFAQWTGASYCVGVANGLDAITLALRAVGVEPRSEVLVPSNTYIATWLAVTAIGAVPIPVEPDPMTHCIDLDALRAAITPRTAAILPVHLYGRAVNMAGVMEIASRYGLAVIEDAAQAHGARSSGMRIGSHGDAVAWSFYPGKNLGAVGDAGAVTTRSADVADRIKVLRNYGSRRKYCNEVIGVNSRLDPIQACVLRVKLRRLDEWNQRRRIAARTYLDGFAGANLYLPPADQVDDDAWHLFVVRVAQREDIMKRLSVEGIETLIHYPIPPHRQEAYSSLGIPADRLPIADMLSAQVLSLPFGPHIGHDDLLRVIEVLKKCVSSVDSKMLGQS